MTPAQQQRKAIERRAKRYARGDFAVSQLDGSRMTNAEVVMARAVIARAYAAGFKAGNVATVKAPAAALLHVLDTQQHLKDKIAQLRAALQSLSHQALVEAGK